MAAVDADYGRRLRDVLQQLNDVVDHYEQLDEHDTNASTDIFDWLPSGLAMAETAVAVLTGQPPDRPAGAVGRSPAPAISSQPPSED